jgi:hypothetical protein
VEDDDGTGFAYCSITSGKLKTAKVGEKYH